MEIIIDRKIKYSDCVKTLIKKIKSASKSITHVNIYSLRRSSSVDSMMFCLGSPEQIAFRTDYLYVSAEGLNSLYLDYDFIDFTRSYVTDKNCNCKIYLNK